MRPFGWARGMAVLDRIVVNIVHMPRVVALVADHVLPKAALPDTAFTLQSTTPAQMLVLRNALREQTFDAPPTRGEISIVRRQCPHAMQVIGQHHDRLDLEWANSADAA